MSEIFSALRSLRDLAIDGTEAQDFRVLGEWSIPADCLCDVRDGVGWLLALPLHALWVHATGLSSLMCAALIMDSEEAAKITRFP